MKVPAALLTLAMAGAAVAQGGPSLPTCAQSCADKFLTGGIGNCGSDPKCICSDKDFLGSIACCLVGVCDAPSQSSAVAFAASLCRGFGVTDLPTAVACSTATGGAATGAAATTTPASASSTESSAASSAVTGSGSSSGSAPTNTAGTSQAPAATAAQSTSKSTNYGPRPTAAAGLGAIGGIMAAVALL
ncbi:hypothetical protein NEMBOFW57_007629 [Staphylotrichum longicolle]|uniref:CFEM domain-containing protein n=1 Tax=Staphylotrichum longicolle TaxID=669026 RepID=A0AAD4HYM8_9PEZI|nr:hypothetical protein NEMBOFW57_007629 [Staphylotrichum longicolle]